SFVKVVPPPPPRGSTCRGWLQKPEKSDLPFAVRGGSHSPAGACAAAGSDASSEAAPASHGARPVGLFIYAPPPSALGRLGNGVLVRGREDVAAVREGDAAARSVSRAVPRAIAL